MIISGFHSQKTILNQDLKGKKHRPATFETPDYVQRKTTVTKQYPDFETNIPTYAGTSAAQPQIQ